MAFKDKELAGEQEIVDFMGQHRHRLMRGEVS